MELIRGTDRFTDLPSWNQDACYNFQTYCYKQFWITGKFSFSVVMYLSFLNNNVDPDNENDDDEPEQNEDDYESQCAVFARDKDGYAILPPYEGMQHKALMSLIRDYTTINYHKWPLSYTLHESDQHIRDLHRESSCASQLEGDGSSS